MSITVVRTEIERFLRSTTPEVLCISGRWGVGKTYSWQKYFRDAEAAGQLGMKRYAYVSLFGLNSLADLRAAIVENTIVADGASASADASTLHDILRRGERFVRKSRPALDIAAGFFRMRDAGDALYRAAFLTVRDQLICFDDLERAGEGLAMRDILGLTSVLREQRGCKVVLLLNKEQAKAGEAAELDRQLEKVVDTFLIYEPTAAEAAEIAVSGEDATATMLRDRLVALDVTNIRVMKKIERWARLLEALLDGADRTILDQAVSTVTLAGWCFLQRDSAPDLQFMRSFNSVAGLLRERDIPAAEQEWRNTFHAYGYGATDELDAEVINGVASGFFRPDAIREAAAIVNARRSQQSRDDSFSEAWALYHGSLTVDDDEVLDAMYRGAIENLTTITPLNMNSAIRFLREYGRDEQASQLLRAYIEANRDTPDFFRRWDRFFGGDPVDEEFHHAMEAGREAIFDARDPLEVLKGMARTSGFNPREDVALLSKLSAEEWIRMFDESSGEDLRDVVQWAHRVAAQPGADELRATLSTALEQIAARSPMRAQRLKSWNVLPTATE